ncbi:MAG: protein-export chaperone SecB [Desulfofustis sp. PB-SRB1]|jgi:preprotein translocase subunit SecB|nr:protein-export chaperone SecB [Desulfofustis sp. PB-SRB1]MBM1000799.1 protein-export chaperone SecB [Desulfofustis sp. PB-SRB1]HBH27848.1 protein-export chaperone SecB [Desulfofustis sp.]HBH30330.1 protein-export chaperone SecB [Desulfofustis sp.]
MTETTGSSEQKSAENPVFRMQKMYVKDFSFENPNAPEVFLSGQGKEPHVELNMKLNNRKIDEAHYEVAIEISAKVTNKEEADKVLFLLEVEHAGAFLIKNVPEKHLPAVLGVECPTLLFPFTRQIVSQISVDGGFIPFLMEPINFMALFHNARKQAGESAEH